MSNLAELCKLQHQLEEAELMHFKALHIRSLKLGDESVKASNSMHCIAVVYPPHP
jgi:hypothetical protein